MRAKRWARRWSTVPDVWLHEIGDTRKEHGCGWKNECREGLILAAALLLCGLCVGALAEEARLSPAAHVHAGRGAGFLGQPSSAWKDTCSDSPLLLDEAGADHRVRCAPRILRTTARNRLRDKDGAETTPPVARVRAPSITSKGCSAPNPSRAFELVYYLKESAGCWLAQSCWCPPARRAARLSIWIKPPAPPAEETRRRRSKGDLNRHRSAATAWFAALQYPWPSCARDAA